MFLAVLWNILPWKQESTVFSSLHMWCEKKNRIENNCKVSELISWNYGVVINGYRKGYGWSWFQDEKQEFTFGHIELEMSITWPTGDDNKKVTSTNRDFRLEL